MIKFHVDRSFASDEKMWLEEAAFNLEWDTRGKLRVDYAYDLDWDGQIRPIPAGEWWLVNLPDASDIAHHFDQKHGVKVLGEADTEHHVVYLLPERLRTHVRFVHTAMHETMHAIGIEHAEDDPYAVMAAIVVPHLPLHLNVTDLEMFCARVDCRASDVLPSRTQP